MPEESVFAVLHITAATGGGADRYIRDLAASTQRRHFVLHVGAEVDVLEEIGAKSFIPLRGFAGTDADTETTAQWLDSAGVGIVHLHGVDEMCRGRLTTLVHLR